MESRLIDTIKVLSKGQSINIDAIRDPYENYYLGGIWLFNIVILIASIIFMYMEPELFILNIIYTLISGIILWLSWKLSYAHLQGSCIKVGENQYPQIYRTIKDASEILEIPVPEILIMQGHGFFELQVAKRYSRRGLIIITSNMLDEFSKTASSREFLMFVGRQLGHIKAGHFRFWFFKETVGQFALFLYSAWSRRCHYTADRVGLLLTGELEAAKQALYIITAGAKIAPSTSYEALLEQRTILFESHWAWWRLIFSSYPYMLDRIIRLHKWAKQVNMSNRDSGIGAISITAYPLKSIPILIIHGHDRLALLELKNMIHTRLPHVVPRVMAMDVEGSLSLPEKFDKVTENVLGAIALMTPDDLGGTALDVKANIQSPRARQNVVIEIGWAWGKLGRSKCLILNRGQIEIPSDLSGAELHTFKETPEECTEIIRQFIGRLS